MAYGPDTIPMGVIALPLSEESQSNVLSFVELLVVSSANLSQGRFSEMWSLLSFFLFCSTRWGVWPVLLFQEWFEDYVLFKKCLNCCNILQGLSYLLNEFIDSYIFSNHFIRVRDRVDPQSVLGTLDVNRTPVYWELRFNL